MRVFAGKEPEGHTWDEVAKWMVEDLQKCVEHGQKYGVLIGIQNHGDFLKTSEQVLKIIQMVNSEWFGTIVDTGFHAPAVLFDLLLDGEDLATAQPFSHLVG